MNFGDPRWNGPAPEMGMVRHRETGVEIFAMQVQGVDGMARRPERRMESVHDGRRIFAGDGV